jgi:hypothetical protein
VGLPVVVLDRAISAAQCDTRRLVGVEDCGNFASLIEDVRRLEVARYQLLTMTRSQTASPRDHVGTSQCHGGFVED